MSISVKALTKYFGQQKAVDGISFEAKPGQILGFLGPNGAGKSTTMKMLTGYLSPSAGEAEVCGQNVVTAPLQVKSLIGYLPENTPLYNEMYVREFLGFVGQLYRVHNLDQRIREVIAMVGLGSEQHKKIGELSKGYKQRVGLAQAIIHNPQVLILDEPTSGLDPNQLADIRKLIRDLGKNKTVILSTHIMQEVEALCDEVIIISKGQIVANATMADLKSQNAGESLEEIFRKLTS
ncbi:ATP-binding cassette domain-containing protein [Pedobacter sp. ASV12]|uniref:ATP-binding cassette domain-containing protein n=1 Tax=Pedobacter sp. ASV12 TaxID=2795120 RepID=UPI0018EB78A9|nr:ATP-binding cassette domain-containing protein [Pedobacter sp. ASV12]